MNRTPFNNIDYSDFIFADQDPRDNMFMRNRQNPALRLLPNDAIGAANNGYAMFPDLVNDATMSMLVENASTPINLDIDALNRGFAEAESNSAHIPSPMTSLPMYSRITSAPSNMPLAMTDMAMQPEVVMSYDNPARHTLDNSPMANCNGSINPYADYLASLQKVSPADSGDLSKMGGSADIPHSMQAGLQNQPPVHMANMTGMVAPTFLYGTNGMGTKKKSMKATAYDIMSDLILRIPIFTYEQEVYIYDKQNGYYRRTPQHEVEQMIMEIYRPLIKEHGNGALIEKVYKLLLKEPYIVRNNVPVSDPTKISFANCTVDLQNQTIGLHSPVNVVTHALNCNLARYNHGREDCPMFDKFLYDISGGDYDLEMRVWEIIGYCLTPDLNAKKFFIFQGVRDSGKSLLCNLLSDFFPDEKVSALGVHSLKETFAKGELRNYVLCISPDLPPAALDSTSTSVIKQITGNDKISAPVKYKNNVQFRFEGKLILASNYPLLTDVPDDAFMQRAVVVPFKHTIPKDSQDVDLLAKMKAEKPAIASKALDAYFRLRNNHYKFSGCYEINDSVLNSDSFFDTPEITTLVYGFLINRYEKATDGLVTIESAYDLFAREVSNQFTEKMFSSVFQKLAEDLYGACHIRSYHGGVYRNARSSVKGIRLKQGHC